MIEHLMCAPDWVIVAAVTNAVTSVLLALFGWFSVRSVRRQLKAMDVSIADNREHYEIQHRPWLIADGIDVPIEHFHGGGATFSAGIHFKNSGSTPALIKSCTVQWQRTEGQRTLVLETHGTNTASICPPRGNFTIQASAEAGLGVTLDLVDNGEALIIHAEVLYSDIFNKTRFTRLGTRYARHLGPASEPDWGSTGDSSFT
jgi:hypothetical protein